MKNYHTHTARCRHASGKDKEYVEKAIDAGITTLGFSDHAPMFFPNDDYYSTFRMLPGEAEEYVSSVYKLKEEYHGKIEIRLGFELEYYPELFEKTITYLKDLGAEYFILGQHYNYNEYEDFAHYSGAATKSAEHFDKYICQVLQAMKTGEFIYVAHPDLFNYTGPNKIYTEKMAHLCEEIKTLGYPLEFNLLGFAQHRNYPNKNFWKIAAETGNDVVIGFDAHSPDSLTNINLYNKAIKYLSGLGIVPTEPDF